MISVCTMPMAQCVSVAFFLLVVVVQASAASYAVADKPSIIAVGDGLTESAFSSMNNGWGLLMQQRYVRKADVINRGFGGFFTPWFVEYMLDTLFDAANPTMAIFFLGVKDSLTQAVSGDHYVSPQQFAANVDKMVQTAKQHGVRWFVFVTPPPVCESCKGKTPKPWDRENAHTVLYVQQLQQLANKYNGAFVDIFNQWQKVPDWPNQYLLPDKLHLNAVGNQQVFEAVMQGIAKSVPEMDPSITPLHYPLMTVIDKNNPAAAFGLVVRKPSSKALAESSVVNSSGSSSNSIAAAAVPQPQQQQPSSAAPSSAGSRATYSLLVLVWGLVMLM